MTDEQWADLRCCSWDRLLTFARRAFPKPGKFGDDQGGDAVALVKFLSDPAKAALAADRLSKIDAAWAAEMQPLYAKIQKALKDREAAEDRLREELFG